jgi:uncharacterized protein (TIGR02145 family)
VNFISTLTTIIFLIFFAMIFFNYALIAQGTVTDIDGNVYHSVTIGTQTWLKENLKTTRYNNGDVIGTTFPVTLDITSESKPKYQWAYDSNESSVATYGRLYTWYAASDSRNVCPTGWHIPTDAEWSALFTYLGGESIAGGKLKETGTNHWISPNAAATNETGFTALPSGTRTNSGTFLFIGFNSQWWRSTEYDTNNAYTWNVSYDQAFIGHSDFSKKSGFSVRCIKDVPTRVDDSQNGKQIPGKFNLNQNYPNPFNPSTVISYRLSVSSNVKLLVYNMLGQKIKTLVNSYQSAGEHAITWNATDNSNNPVSSGIYFYKMEANGMSLQKKMILVR